MNKKYYLEGLDCASCLKKIEDDLRKSDLVEDVVINFTSKTITIQVQTDNDLKNLVQTTINKYENNIVVKEMHEEQDQHRLDKKEYSILILGVLVFIIVSFIKFNNIIELVLYITAYFLIGYKVVFTAIKNIFNKQFFDENFLMTVATIGAFSIQEYPEAVAVMLFYQVGELFQTLAVNKSRRSIKALLNLKPDFANLVTADGIKKLDPDLIKIDDEIIVKVGEKIPLDAVVISGKSYVDNSALTGESKPVFVTVDSQVYAGTINQTAVLNLKVVKLASESTVSKILDLVENASNKKAKTENFITKFAHYYTPVVVLIALFMAVVLPLVLQDPFSVWINRGLVFLVVSCPCALVLSIPLGFFGGLGKASHDGILVKGSNYLEALNKIDTVVLDKTGTLTKGNFKVIKINNVSKLSDLEILKYAAHAEIYSTHPIAKSIVEAYGQELDEKLVSNYEELAGQGTKLQINGKDILLGNEDLLKKNQVNYEACNQVGTIVYLVIDNEYAANLVIADELKDDAIMAISNLKALGIKNIVMLTGDNEVVAKEISTQVGLTNYYANLHPSDKLDKLEEIMSNKQTNGAVLFVGDGINDAPVLTRADVGISMGGLGSDAAVEASDIVILNDEPSKIVTAINIANKTRRIVWQNIYFALGLKLLVLILATFGVATIWEAVFADVGVSLIAVLNASRILKIRK